MILQDALCNIKAEVMALGYFNRFYDKAELIERNHGNEKFPQVYVGNGQYQPIYDLDVNGTGYIRKDGDVRSEVINNDRLQVTSCNDDNPLIDLVFPLRLVAAVPKKTLSDNAYSDDMLVFDLLAIIGRRQSAVVNTHSVTGRVVSYDTDRDTVWSSEVRGIDKQVKLDISYVSINFTLTFRSALDCIRQNCNY